MVAVVFLVLSGLAGVALYVFIRHPDLLKLPAKWLSPSHFVAAAATSVRPSRHRRSHRARKRTDRTETPNATTGAGARSRTHRLRRTTKPSDGGQLKPSEAAKPEPIAGGAAANAVKKSSTRMSHRYKHGTHAGKGGQPRESHRRKNLSHGKTRRGRSAPPAAK
jgi:hypothetical protein